MHFGDDLVNQTEFSVLIVFPVGSQGHRCSWNQQVVKSAFQCLGREERISGTEDVGGSRRTVLCKHADIKYIHHTISMHM